MSYTPGIRAGSLIREARRRAGLTQTQLATRMGVRQPVVARLESPRSNPSLRSLERALAATGHRLELGLHRTPAVDVELIRQQLALAPAERLRQLERQAKAARRIALAGARSRGEPA